MFEDCYWQLYTTIRDGKYSYTTKFLQKILIYKTFCVENTVMFSMVFSRKDYYA